MPGQNGNGNEGGDYGGDEEVTPAESVLRKTSEARRLADAALALSSVGARLWDVARLVDTVDGDRRRALLASAVAEMSGSVDAIAALRTALRAMKEEDK